MRFFKTRELALLATVLSLAALSAPAQARKSAESTKEVEPVGVLTSGIKFSYSPEAAREFAQAVREGRAFVDKYLRENPDKAHGRLAFVSDIDETILDNRVFMKEKAATASKEVEWTGWEDWIDQARATPLRPSIELLKYARSRGVAIFLITGRQEHLRRSTIANLVKYGIAYDGLYMRKNGDKTEASKVKPEYRKQIEEMGYTIIGNIGDQQSDLSGGHCLNTSKLPNRMYSIK